MVRVRTVSRAAWMAFGVGALCFGLTYDVAQVVDLAGGFPAPWGHFAVVLPSLLLAWSWLAVVTLVHESAVGHRRQWTSLALSFSTAYAALNSFVYIVQLAVVVPEALSGGPGLAGPFAMVGGRALTAVNAVAYALLSLSAVFLGLSHHHFARKALIAHGCLAPFIVAILYVPALLPVGALWIVTFPVAAIALLVAEDRLEKAGA
jgi:hypothetical protein